MKLVHPKIETAIEFNYSNVHNLIIEHQVFFYNCVAMLQNQCDGEEGKFVLSDGEIVKLSECVDIVIDYVNLDINNRKLINALHKLLVAHSTDSQLQLSLSEITTLSYQYLSNLTDSVDLKIQYNLDFDVSGILKLYDVKIENYFENLLEKLINFINATIQLRKIDVLILVNIKSYLSNNELLDLYKHCEYNKLNLLLIESQFRNKVCDKEQYIIIDKDLCEIVA